MHFTGTPVQPLPVPNVSITKQQPHLKFGETM